VAVAAVADAGGLMCPPLHSLYGATYASLYLLLGNQRCHIVTKLLRLLPLRDNILLLEYLYSFGSNGFFLIIKNFWLARSQPLQ